jgi:hypothetical protein
MYDVRLPLATISYDTGLRNYAQISGRETLLVWTVWK